jgi:3',5'-cyclic AMP phosphodiesterase CpdA
MPTVAVAGNHEYDVDRRSAAARRAAGGGRAPHGLATRWPHRFEFPRNGPESLHESAPETVYWFDFQGVRFVSLNSMEDFATQADWLREVLAENPNRWTIVSHHHPVFSASGDRDNPELRAAWQPVYDQYRVDLVLQGHDHGYARTGLRTYQNVATGAHVRDGRSGTVYVVSVSGPKMYDRNQASFARRAEDTQLYQLIRVDGDRLCYEARTATGTLYDAFTLVKRDGQPNELVRQVPDTPERLRPATRAGSETEG